MPGSHVRCHAVDDTLLGVDKIFEEFDLGDSELPQARNVEQSTRRAHEDVGIDVPPCVAQLLPRVLEDAFQLLRVDHGRRGEPATAAADTVIGWRFMLA